MPAGEWHRGDGAGCWHWDSWALAAAVPRWSWFFLRKPAACDAHRSDAESRGTTLTPCAIMTWGGLWWGTAPTVGCREVAWWRTNPQGRGDGELSLGLIWWTTFPVEMWRALGCSSVPTACRGCQGGAHGWKLLVPLGTCGTCLCSEQPPQVVLVPPEGSGPSPPGPQMLRAEVGPRGKVGDGIMAGNSYLWGAGAPLRAAS